MTCLKGIIDGQTDGQTDRQKQSLNPACAHARGVKKDVRMAMPKIFKQEVGMAVCNKGRAAYHSCCEERTCGWVVIDEVATAHTPGSWLHNSFGPLYRCNVDYEAYRIRLSASVATP